MTTYNKSINQLSVLELSLELDNLNELREEIIISYIGSNEEVTYEMIETIDAIDDKIDSINCLLHKMNKHDFH